jgi:hypothetical protein
MALIDGVCISTWLAIYDESHWKTHVQKQRSRCQAFHYNASLKALGLLLGNLIFPSR